MKNVISWCNDIEENTQQQIDNLRNHPIVDKWIAIMPVCHFGYGVPICTVFGSKSGVIPNCIGVDIGGGVTAVISNLMI